MEPLHKIAQILSAHGQHLLATEVANLSVAMKEASNKEALGDRYLPPEARGKEPMVPEGTDLAVWEYESNGKLYAVVFAGKQSKPLWHHLFRTEAQRAKLIEETANSRKSLLDQKNKRNQERLEFKHEFNVGDILVSSWGYEQTNIDFYEVTQILGPAMVAIREVDKKLVRQELGADYVMPVPGSYDGPVLRKKVSPGHSVRLNSHSSARKWDGKPEYQTASGYGH